MFHDFELIVVHIKFGVDFYDYLDLLDLVEREVDFSEAALANLLLEHKTAFYGAILVILLFGHSVPF